MRFTVCITYRCHQGLFSEHEILVCFSGIYPTELSYHLKHVSASRLPVGDEALAFASSRTVLVSSWELLRILPSSGQSCAKGHS